MNKIKKVLISIFGAIDVTFYIVTPVFLTLIIIEFFQVSVLETYLLLITAFASTLFRAFKIGWMK